MDEYELENELAQLEQEAIAQEMSKINLPTVPDNPLPSYGQRTNVPANKSKHDDLAELEQWAS